jgi:hypothetical protein
VAPESAGGSSTTEVRRSRFEDLRRREAEYDQSRRHAAEIGAAVALIDFADLGLVEEYSNRVAAGYRQLATAAWELSRARGELVE